MRWLTVLVLILITAQDTTMSFYDFKMNGIDGTAIDFSACQGKKVLIVNTASECGYTPQYEDLQMLHETHGDKVVVLGFPANNFGGQEPGANMAIQQFCKANYGVTFQMFEKVSVKGSDRHALFTWLAEASGNEPNWNFCKYLIDENGKVLGFFPSSVNPMEEAITSLL